MKIFTYARRATAKHWALAVLLSAFAPTITMAQAPVVSGLPETVTGTQSAPATSGPLGTTYSTFQVATATNPTPLVPGSTYKAWCFNPYGYIAAAGGTFTNPVSYTAYSSYDPNFLALPGVGSGSPATDWAEVNWVINHETGESGTLTPSVLDVQNVIWDLLVPGYDTTDLSASGTQLLSDAQQYGPNFIPGPGQFLAIPLYVAGINPNDGPNNPQDIFVQYPLPCPPKKPGIKISKCASVTTAKCTDKVTYNYTVTNTGDVTLTNIVVTDDNATPGYPQDDFTVGTIASLAPGQSVTLTATVYLPVTETAVDQYGNVTNHTLIKQILSNGDVQVTLLEDTNLVDNTYGFAATPDWPNGNSLASHLGEDSAEFVFTDAAGNEILDFAADYISTSHNAPLGVATEGLGGAGQLYWGNGSNIESISTTLSDNLNRPYSDWGFLFNSPPPGYNNNWNFQCGYKVVIKQCAFGRRGFGDCQIKQIQHGQCKFGKHYQCHPQPSCVKVTNTGTATVSYNGTTITAQAQATVQLTNNSWQGCNQQPPPKCQPKSGCPQIWWKKCGQLWQSCKWW